MVGLTHEAVGRAEEAIVKTGTAVSGVQEEFIEFQSTVLETNANVVKIQRQLKVSLQHLVLRQLTNAAP